MTRWFEQGLDIKEIQYLAGHSTVDITLDIYTHYMNKERGKKTAEKINFMILFSLYALSAKGAYPSPVRISFAAVYSSFGLFSSPQTQS